MLIACIPMEIAFHGKFQFIVFSRVTDTETLRMCHLPQNCSTGPSISHQFQARNKYGFQEGLPRLKSQWLLESSLNLPSSDGPDNVHHQ